jgi:hypothetical protein
VSRDTITLSLKENGITPVLINKHQVLSEEDWKTIEHLYVDENLSANKIGQMYNTTSKVIRCNLKKRGVHIRGLQECQYTLQGKELPPEFFDRDFMFHMHREEHKDCARMGEYFGVNTGTVSRQLKRLGITPLTNSEVKKGLKVGKDHPNWKGGVTELDKLLREFFQVNCVPQVAKRDNYTCQMCGATHTVLHVHHIIPFSKIVKDIR